ncbi:MAG: hypothetical protein ACFE8N_03775 [Promethearchaeota archaeon]
MRNKKALIISLSIILTISTVLLLNNFIISLRIYYAEFYYVDLPNSEEIIEKAETFDYLEHVKMHNQHGEVYNLSKFGIQYIDRDYINYSKEKVYRESKNFHLWPGYHFLISYTFNATLESKLYFTYNNNTVFNATYETDTTIFETKVGTWVDYIGSWYINFTQVPYVVNQSSTILLNNTILVKMILNYDHLYGNLGGMFYRIKQYVVFNSELQVILICTPAVPIAVA